MKIRVYYEDTDCGNVVYYANYLRFMERSRTEYLRERNIDLAKYHEHGIMFAVIEAHIKYRAPARYNDLLDVESKVAEKTSVSISFETQIRDANGKLLVTGSVRLACMNASGKATRIPAEIRDILHEEPFQTVEQ